MSVETHLSEESLASPPVVLAYAAAPTSSRREWVWQAVWLSLMVPAAVVPFVSFTYGTSPYDAVREIFGTSGSESPIECCGASFFIAYAILAWRLRRALWRRPGKIELRLALLGAILCSAPVIGVLAFTLPTLERPSSDSDIVEFIAIGAMPLCLMAGVLIAVIARRRDSADSVEALMIAPYLVNAVFCLVAFYNDPEAGYWLTIMAGALLATRMLVIAFSSKRRAYAE